MAPHQADPSALALDAGAWPGRAVSAGVQARAVGLRVGAQVSTKGAGRGQGETIAQSGRDKYRGFMGLFCFKRRLP